jgi:2-methylcitrate dehydratase PrpD
MNKIYPTEQLASYASDIRYEDLPGEVVNKAKECILDTIGCVLEGSKSEDFAKLFRSLRKLGEGPVPVWGTSETTTLQNSVMLHASMAHSTEYDDSHKQSKTHPGAVIFPAAMESSRLDHSADGKRLIAAVVAGYEVALRIGIALGAGEHRLSGWHATATCGIFGAAAASGRMLGLDRERMISALGSAGTQASGIWAFASDGSMSKQLHAGKASQGGLLSAILARNDFTGCRYILEAEDGGFFRTFAPERTEDWKEIATKDLGTKYEILNMAFKPYPCCRTTHCAIDAAIALQKKHNLAVEQIRRVTIHTYDVAVKQCGFSNPANPRLAQFSFAYVTAVALKKKKPITSADFSEALLRDEDLMGLHRKVEVRKSEELDRCFPKTWPCEVEVEMMSGESYRERVDVAAGDSLVPLSDSDRKDKFFGCAEDAIPLNQAKDIVEKAMNLENSDNLQDFCRLLVK